MGRVNTIKMDADAKSFSKARDFVEESLEARRVNARIVFETTQLFEALFSKIISQCDASDAQIEMSNVNRLGHTDIKMVFPGKRFSPLEGDVSTDLDAKIIEAFSDKMSCSYRGGYNVVRISVAKSPRAFILPNVIAIVAALLVSIVFAFTLDDAGQDMVVMQCIVPLQKLFTNAVLMIAAPMTLFSLLKNVTGSFIVAERHSSSRKLFMTSVASSIVAIILALVMGYVFSQAILMVAGTSETIDLGLDKWSLASAVDQIIPSSILAPFESISPVPMIVVALLVACALCTMGKSFDAMKRAIDACYDLFSSILSIVMAAFPIACFLLFLEVLMSDNGGLRFLLLLAESLFVLVCVVPLLVTYAVRLGVHGVNVPQFAKKLRPLVKENLVIGSVIDAVPFNTRYCAKVFGFSRGRLEKELPVLAQISLDGNCFILMLLATTFVYIANCPVSWPNVVIICLIVLFLSFGAPNQPGSILIGMLIILTYLNFETATSIALCFELFCGGLQNIVNVISSIVMVAEGESREKA